MQAIIGLLYSIKTRNIQDNLYNCLYSLWRRIGHSEVASCGASAHHLCDAPTQCRATDGGTDGVLCPL